MIITFFILYILEKVKYFYGQFNYIYDKGI